jgi:hypothetical protein
MKVWRVKIKKNWSECMLKTAEGEYFFSAAHAIDLQKIADEHNEAMKGAEARMILYIADLKRDGLIKVGITTEGRLDARLAELRRRFGPDVEIFESAPIPDGWGTAQQWENRLLAEILRPRFREQVESFDGRDDYGHGLYWSDEKERAYREFWRPASLIFEVHENCGEVVKATPAEATTAFRKLFAAADCGSAMRPKDVAP